MAVNFDVDSVDRKYMIWWNGEPYDNMLLALFYIEGEEEGRKVWEHKLVSSDYRGWYAFPEHLDDGLYGVELSNRRTGIVWREEIWIGQPGKALLFIEQFRGKDYYKITLLSDLPLTENDYIFRTARRDFIKGTALQQTFNERNQYKATFLLKIENPSSFLVILSEKMERRLGKVQTVKSMEEIHGVHL